MSNVSAPKRVIVADTEPIFAYGMATVLRQSPDLWIDVFDGHPAGLHSLESADITVIGMDADIKDIWLMCDKLMSLPGARSTKFVVVFPGRSDFEMTAAASLDAAAVIPRSSTLRALTDAVAAVVAGRRLVSASLSEQLLADFSGMIARQRDSVEVDLTSREREILELIAEGLSNRMISGQLHISENTVKNHVRHILDKLDATSRGQAVAEATRRGMLLMGHGVFSPSSRVAKS